MPKYSLVKQGCISRWKYGSEKKGEQCGFYTGGFYNCIIVILRDKHNKKLVMMHADPQVTLGDVKNEIQWVGENCEKYIYYKEN